MTLGTNLVALTDAKVRINICFVVTVPLQRAELVLAVANIGQLSGSESVMPPPSESNLMLLTPVSS